MKITVYLKGDRDSTDYYRMYQYFDLIENNTKTIRYRQQMSKSMYKKWMPVSEQNIFIKVFIYTTIYIRIIFFLLCDLINKPNIIIIHRSIISRYMPYSFRYILTLIRKRNCKIIWDFDDHIVESGEVTASVFNFFSKLSHKIIVTHSFLKDLIPVEYRNKVSILPTTDGDMYQLFNIKLNQQRIETLKRKVVLIWVATSGNLPFLKEVLPYIESAAQTLHNNNNKVLELKVLCNKPIKCNDTKYLKIHNIKWTRTKAIFEMQASHIGIMPLADTNFTRGKGGFKLIQYISIGLPCIGSNVGFNKNIIKEEFGCLVNNNRQEWCNAIIRLSDTGNWNNYSLKAYKYWNDNFSFNKNLSIWINIIENI